MQSLDNQILVYSARDKIRINNKKVFKGHIVAGYACQIAVSPDGQYVASGDHLGKLWLWEWKTGKLKHNFPRDCHSTVLMSCVWHPHEPSRVVTAGWDNQIKYWD
jgi:pre-mRNA-processing factor 17